MFVEAQATHRQQEAYQVYLQIGILRLGLSFHPFKPFYWRLSFSQMAHYMNDYSKLWSHARELERKVTEVGAAKSSLKAEVARLNGAISKERKKRMRTKGPGERIKQHACRGMPWIIRGQGSTSSGSRKHGSLQGLERMSSRSEGICFYILSLW